MDNRLVFDTGFFIAPNEIFDSEEAKVHEKLVYLYLCRCANNSLAAFPSYTKIAEKCSISRRKAIDCVEWLTENGFLAKTVRRNDDKNMSNLYEIFRGAAKEVVHDMHQGGVQHAPTVVHSMHQGGAQHALGVVHDMHQGGAQHAPYKELYINNHSYKELNKKDNAPPTESHDSYSSEFENFWKEYPRFRRKDKSKTFNLWKKKIKAADRQKLIECTIQYAIDFITIGTNGEFSKAPSTYLNAETWKDYLPGVNENESGSVESNGRGSSNNNQYNGNGETYAGAENGPITVSTGNSGYGESGASGRSAQASTIYDEFVRR